jgi:hypothetical protein
VASYAHPLFWAPFIIVGESASHTHWRTIPQNHYPIPNSQCRFPINNISSANEPGKPLARAFPHSLTRDTQLVTRNTTSAVIAQVFLNFCRYLLLEGWSANYRVYSLGSTRFNTYKMLWVYSRTY